jgi:prepilin-type processing-associated H-X9-DG protein
MDWTVAPHKATDGLSKTFLIGERTYQIRAWMLGAYWNPPRSDGASGGRRGGPTGPPDGPQPSTAFFACKNLTDKVALNHDPYDGCYVGHDNELGDRPAVPASTPRVISVNDLPFASFHPSGVNFSFGDGGVRFINDDIDTDLYLALGSRNGEEVAAAQ